MASENVITFTSENFESEVLKSEVPVLVDFWAAWCGPCRMIGPIVDELADEYQGKVKVGKVNVDEQREIASKYKVMSIPTLLLIKNGEVANQAVGARPKKDLKAMIENA